MTKQAKCLVRYYPSAVISIIDINNLWFYSCEDSLETQGFRKILVTESIHPYMNAWWHPGHGIGYEHTYTRKDLEATT